MPLIFSPLSEDILEGPFQPLPRHAFIMANSGKNVAAVEAEMANMVAARLKAHKYRRISAVDVRSTKDYLEKIIQMVRGCGFGVAILSEFTPADTAGNIFFEVAHCNLLGKPVILVKTEAAKPPSDLVRTEWIAYERTRQRKLATDLDRAIKRMRELASFYERLGHLAFDAPDFDGELAFERYRQAFLITGDKRTKNRITAVRDRLASINPSSTTDHRLPQAIAQFLTLLRS